MTWFRLTPFALAPLVGFLLAAGCSSDSGRSEASKGAIEGLRGTREELVKAKADVQQANEALDKLGSGKKIEQTFGQYTSAVTKVRAAGDRAREKGADMRARQRQYVDNWEREMAATSNPELKAGAAQRRDAVRGDFGRVMLAAQAVTDSYRPYVSHLEDIRRALSNDLTPAGLAPAKPVIAKAKQEGQALLQNIDGLIAQLDAMAGNMSAGGAKASTE